MTTKHPRKRPHPWGNQSPNPIPHPLRVTRSRSGRLWIIFHNGELVFFGSKQETAAWLRGRTQPAPRPILHRGPDSSHHRRWLI